MCATYKRIPVVLAAIWSIAALAKDARDAAPLQGICDGHNGCTVNLNRLGLLWEKLCGSPDFSVFWTRGESRYLIQCRSENTSEENVVWIVDKKTDFFGRLNFGRFFNKNILKGPGVEIEDKFRSRRLCNKLDASKINSSDFVLLEKKPTNDGNDPYCYEPVYLVFINGQLTVEANGVSAKNGDIDHAVHAVSIQDRRRLDRLLSTIKK